MIKVIILKLFNIKGTFGFIGKIFGFILTFFAGTLKGTYSKVGRRKY